MTSLMVSGMDGREDSLSGVVFTSCTAFGPLIRKFSNSSSDAEGKESGVCDTNKITYEIIPVISRSCFGSALCLEKVEAMTNKKKTRAKKYIVVVYSYHYYLSYYYLS